MHIPDTTNEKETVEAVMLMKPKMIIHCQYDSLGLFTKSYNPADVEWPKSGVEKTEARGVALKSGQSYSTKER